jgi:hypothetical protein
METRDSSIPSTTPLPYSYSPPPAADAASGEVSGTGRGLGRRSPQQAAVRRGAGPVGRAAALGRRGAGRRPHHIAPPRPMPAGVATEESAAATAATRMMRAAGAPRPACRRRRRAAACCWRRRRRGRRQRVPLEQRHAAMAAHGIPLSAGEELDERSQW